MLTIAAAGLIALTATLGAGPAKAPPPANQLYGVSCPSANDCVAVGINENAETSGGGALIQSWTGKTWTSVAPKAPKGALSTDLLGVSCATAKSCVAVGLYLNSGGVAVPLAETWNGKTWTPGTPARPKGSTGGQLDNVSCRTAKSCVAVGFIDADFNDGGHTGKAAATAWNGRSWTAATVAAPGKGKASLFNEVSCPAAAACRAVGQLGPYNSDEGSGLAGFWNGKGWGLRTTP